MSTDYLDVVLLSVLIIAVLVALGEWDRYKKHRAAQHAWRQRVQRHKVERAYKRFRDGDAA